MCEEDKLVRRKAARTFDPVEHFILSAPASSPYQRRQQAGHESNVSSSSLSDGKKEGIHDGIAMSLMGQNPAPKPLGYSISVVEAVTVSSDPNLLRDKDSVLECLEPLIYGSAEHTRTSASSSSTTSRKRKRMVVSRENSLEPAGAAPEEAPSSTTTSSMSSCVGADIVGTTRRGRRRSGTSTGGRPQDRVEEDESLFDEEEDAEVDLTDHQAALWNKRFEELVAFRRRFGHCLVPHNWPENLALATWVKRQRYQWKLKEQGKRSTLTKDRRDVLSDLEFVWDSHNAIWEERFNELVEFKRKHGHTNVPSTHTNHSLSVWVQCQRRQWKLMKDGTNKDEGSAASSAAPGAQQQQRIKQNRVDRLEALGFVWEPRRKQGRGTS